VDVHVHVQYFVILVLKEGYSLFKLQVKIEIERNTEREEKEGSFALYDYFLMMRNE